MNAEKQINQIAKLFGDWSFREDAAKRIVQYWWHIQMIMADPVAPAPKQIPTNPDGSPLDVVNFVRIVNWTNSAMKTLEAWTGHKWQMTNIGATRQWGNVRDLIIAVDDNAGKSGREAHWGSPITRDSNTGAQVDHSFTPDTSHLPAGERIGQIAIERSAGPCYDVHLWNGFGWINVGPGSFTDEKTATFFANELTGQPAAALAGERSDTVTKIMGGAFRVTKTPNDCWAVERYSWSSLLEDCGPEFWPWRTFESEDAAETTILRYGHRVGETVTLVRRDGAEIVSAAPGAGSFPRQVDDYAPEAVRSLANTIGETIEVKVAGDMPTAVEVTRTALTDIVEASTTSDTPASAIEIYTCEIRNSDMPGDCFDVVVWTGHTWRVIAKGVSKRTAEGVVQARKNDTETEPVNPIKQTVIKRQRRLMAEVKREIGEFHVDILGRQDRGDTVIGINELRDKLAMVLDYFND